MRGQALPLVVVVAMVAIVGAGGVVEATQIGVDDQRVSDMGPDADADFDAGGVAIAYAPDADRYLVVWIGDDDSGTGPSALVDGEQEVFGQLIDGATGAEIGPNDFRISDMGQNGNPAFDALGAPAVAYSTVQGEFLVVWSGNDGNGELEIYGQRLTVNGVEVGVNDFRISDMGVNGVTTAEADSPAVAYNATADEYLVVWRGDDAALGTVDNEFEIYGQRIVAADGSEEAPNDFRISDMGPDGSTAFGAHSPDVAWSSFLNQYAVVWAGFDDTPPLVEGELEIFFQRLQANTFETGPNDVRISFTGPDGDVDFLATTPAIAFSGDDAHEYAVVWSAVNGTVLTSEGPEIYLKRISDGGFGGLETRITTMGPDADLDFGAFAPDVAYDLDTGEILVVWSGDDDSGDLVDHELEIYGQLLSPIGVEIGFDDQRLSVMGPDGDHRFRGVAPAVAYNSVAGELAVVWTGEDDDPPLVLGENEIFLQRYHALAFRDGFESGDTTAWSATTP